MSLKFLNEGFELSQFNVLQESVVKQITSILNTLNEATMSDEDRRDSKLLRQILSKASDASYDKRRALKWTPQELEIADKYNLTLPQRTTNWDGSKEITPLKDNDVDYKRGFGRNTQVRSLQRDLQQAKGLYYKTDANMADFIRKRKEKGPAQDRPYRQADKYARVDDVNTFGDTTFTHDNSGRFGQDRWDKEHNRPATLAGGPRDSDLTDVEKDRVAVNKQMSQPVRDMKAALADRKANQKDLDNVNLNYARNVADARKRFDDAMAYADEQRQKESERGQQGVADANSRINKLLKKESFIRALEEKLNSLNEAEMSDEDKHDSEILKQIYQKTQARANAALTQEEKDVLKKYNLERVPYSKNIRSAEGPYRTSIFDDKEFESSYKWSTGKELPPKSDKINYADRARKRPERDAQQFDMRDRDFWDMPTPNYERNHEIEDGKYRSKTYQQRQRYSDNQKMTQNVRDMTRALRDRKDSQKKLDSADSVYQAEIDKLKKEYEDRLARAQRSQKYRTDSDRRNLDYANQRISSLLKKENYNRMNKEVISEALDSLKNRLVEAYEDFDEFYDDVWQKAMDSGIEVVDYDIQGREGTTWVRFDDDDDVFTIDESELVDGLENVFNTTRDIDDAIEVIRDVATPSMSYNEGLNRIRAKTITLKEFLSSIKSYLRNINEAEMSDEDRHDSDILAQIYKKSIKGPRNFKLSPEEKEVLKKFGLKRGWLDNVKLNNAKHMADWYYNVVTPDGEPIFSPYDSNDQFIRAGRDYKLQSGADAFFKPDMIVSDKINYADRARKRPERSSRGFTWSQKQHRMDKDDQDYRTFDQAKDEKRKSSYPYSESINEAKGGPRLVTTLDVPDNFNTNLWKKYHLSKDGQTGEYLVDVDHLFDLIHTYRYDNWPRGEWDIDHMKRIRNQAKHEIEFGVPDPNDKTTSGRWDRYGETPEEAIRNIDATLAGVAKAEKDLLNRGEQRFGRKFKDIADLKYYMDNERYGDFYKIDKSKVTRHL